MQATPATNSIVSRAVLVDLTISRRTGITSDAIATESVRKTYHANGNVGTYGKKLFPQDPPEIKRVSAVVNKTVALHRDMTLPWQTGWRILPRELHSDYAAKISECRLEMEDAVRALCDALPRLKDEARLMLNELYRDSDYPSAAEMAMGYGIAVRFMPVPDVGDFRVALDAATIADLQQSYQRDMDDALRAATRDAFVRMTKVLTNLSEACTRVDAKVAEGAKLAVIRTAVTENIRDLLAMLPALNVGNDATLAAIGSEVEAKLASINIDDLRADPLVRDDARRKADAILQKMKAFVR